MPPKGLTDPILIAIPTFAHLLAYNTILNKLKRQQKEYDNKAWKDLIKSHFEVSAPQSHCNLITF